MQPEERDNAYLWDMLDAAKAVAEFVHSRTQHEYMNDRQLRGAVERHLEIIGEAARRLSPAARSQHPEIPWRSIIAQRNVLAHEYGEIQDERIWRVATVDIPRLIVQLTPLVGGDE